MVEIEHQHQHQNQCRDDLHCADDKQYQHCEKIIHILWPRWKAKSSLKSSSVQVGGREGKGVQCKRLLLEIHHRSISPLPEWFLYLIPFFLQLSWSCWGHCHYNFVAFIAIEDDDDHDDAQVAWERCGWAQAWENNRVEVSRSSLSLLLSLERATGLGMTWKRWRF